MTSDDNPHRFDLLRDAVTSDPRPSLIERAAANRREMLVQLHELAAIIVSGGAEKEGIDTAELNRIRSTALHLAVAADTALSMPGTPA